MEEITVPEHESSSPPNQKLVESDRFQHIKEMIELPEEDVSATFQPREADDKGLPLMLLFMIGVAIIAMGTMAIIFFGVGNSWINLTLGTHFTK